MGRVILETENNVTWSYNTQDFKGEVRKITRHENDVRYRGVVLNLQGTQVCQGVDHPAILIVIQEVRDWLDYEQRMLDEERGD